MNLTLPKDPLTPKSNLLAFQSCCYLNIFPLSFIVENVGYVLGENLLTTRSSVDADHGYPDRPGSVSDSHLKVGIVCLKKHSVHTLSKTRTGIRRFFE